ncbi:CRISPR-associated endonuclease Cas1 [Tepidimonas alkaliphilus]|uniref:CRISPR-associated endonuclease Cas1 n=1 Tax=Tepidimonas alkaliphilus TaxID=2588942 RepID=A0A554W3W0_9BURK|nr:type I-F CRISPR-associated endonuclease Cas1f [Tepidimonas alkaliphilus]TSE18252.1 CRISPR-associated endonuclease Cas1 [Tepidimonas alkaliphilus]
MSQEPRSRAVLMSRRANVYYLEHVRLVQRGERLMYLSESGENIDQFINIPYKNTAFILLGKGTSITDAAARRLAEANIVLGFCGSGGSPLLGATDATFWLPQDEYRPTEYMQAWARMWFDEGARLKAAKEFLDFRADLAKKKLDVEGAVDAAEALKQAAKHASSTEDLLSAEAVYARRLYAILARKYKIDFSREPGKGKKETASDLVNSFLDHGNYLAYGYAACALHTLGISFAFPVLHGKTRRGALVFDVADLVKDWLVMPLAFEFGVKKSEDRELRAAIIRRAHDDEVLDLLMTFVKSICEKYSKNQGLAQESPPQGSA